MYIDFGVSQEIFFSEYLYKKPILLSQAVRQIDVNWRHINEVYERADAADKNFKLMKGYEVPKKEYIESYLNVGKVEYRYIKSVVYEYMRRGATLVHNRIKNEPFVDDLARQVAKFAEAQTITSGYAAFSASSSYRSHWDTRDVFAVQLLGRKRWIIKAPSFELPLYMQQTKNIAHAEEPEEVYLDVILEPGDVLYIPRGWWHNPLPVGEDTFHLAIGTFAPTGFDYVKWLLKNMPNVQACRKNFRLYQQDESVLNSIGDSIRELVVNRANYEDFMSDYIGQHRINSTISLDILGNGQVGSLASAQRLRLNANLLYQGVEGCIVVNGNKMNVDGVSFKLIEYIFLNPLCTVEHVCCAFASYQEDLLNTLLFKLGLSDVVELVGEPLGQPGWIERNRQPTA